MQPVFTLELVNTINGKEGVRAFVVEVSLKVHERLVAFDGTQ